MLIQKRQVHCVEQIVDVVVQQGGVLNAGEEINLWYPMRETRVWKANPQLRGIVQLSVEILKMFRGVHLPDAEIKSKVLGDFEEIWRYMVDPLLEKEPILLRQFIGGGWLRKELLGNDLHQQMTEIRNTKKKDYKKSTESGGTS